MSRFDNWPKPTTPIKQSAGMIEDFAALSAGREKADGDISHWAAKVDDAWLAKDMTWFSGAANREVSAPHQLLVTHFFNHQTHHRGQAHCLLTEIAGEAPSFDLLVYQRQTGTSLIKGGGGSFLAPERRPART